MLRSICIGGQCFVLGVMSHPLTKLVQSTQFVRRPPEYSSAYFVYSSLLLFIGKAILKIQSEHCLLQNSDDDSENDLLVQKECTITRDSPPALPVMSRSALLTFVLVHMPLCLALFVWGSCCVSIGCRHCQ